MEIDGYDIEGEVGRGGMGVVYLARQRSLGRNVAIKVLRGDYGVPGDEAVERFRREVKTLSSLTHPNIVAVFEFGEVDGGPYFVMPYLEGGNLSDRIESAGRLSSADAASIGAGVAHGLAAAHEEGIVHRDVKPSNVLFDRRGHPYLGDFGVARLAEGTRLTRTTAMVGSPIYLAPELALGGDPTPAADLYSLGTTLYECLAGEPPFSGDDPFAVMYQHRHEDVPALPDGVDPAVRDVVLALLSKDADERPSGAEEAADMLTRATNAGPAAPAPEISRASRGKDTVIRDRPAANNPAPAPTPGRGSPLKRPARKPTAAGTDPRETRTTQRRATRDRSEPVSPEEPAPKRRRSIPLIARLAVGAVALVATGLLLATAISSGSDSETKVTNRVADSETKTTNRVAVKPPGTNSGLDQFWRQCDSGDMESCEDLYYESDYGSRYEGFGYTCGDRAPRAVALNCVARF